MSFKLKLIVFFVLSSNVIGTFACSFLFVNNSPLKVKLVQEERREGKPKQEYEILSGQTKFIPGAIEGDAFFLYILGKGGWKQIFVVEETKCARPGQEAATLKFSDLMRAQKSNPTT